MEDFDVVLGVGDRVSDCSLDVLFSSFLAQCLYNLLIFHPLVFSSPSLMISDLISFLGDELGDDIIKRRISREGMR
jgi:hypothetical protein